MNARRLRRFFLTTTLLGALSSAAHASVVFDGVAAGDASSTDAILWTRADNGGSATGLTAQVATDANFNTIVATPNGTTTAASDFTLKLDATGLAANTHYYYRFLAPGGVISPTGQFTTAPSANQKVDVKFGFSGDADGRFRPYPSVANIGSQNLNYFVFLGDTMYETASTGSPAVPVLTPQTTDPAALASALTSYNEKYLNNVVGVNPANGLPSATGQQGLQPLLAATGTYTLLDNHELGNQALQSGGAPPAGPFRTTDPSFDVNKTGSYNNKTAAFQTVEKSYLDYHPTRESIVGTPAGGYALNGPQVNAPSDPRSNGTPQLYFAQQWGANSIYIQTDDRSYRDIRLMTPTSPGANTTMDDLGPRADNPNRTMLGTTQLQWLENTLLQAQKDGVPWKFVAISSPIDQVGAPSATGRQPNGQPDGTQTPDGKSWWGGYRSEREQLLKFIADNHIDHVVFLTTDDHMARVTQLQYLTDPNDPNSKALVPDAFQVVAGPIGAGGPDGYTDHSFATLLTAANDRNASQLALGEPQLGLPADFPGLSNVFRDGDPNASASPSPVDFFSPDTFNYITLDIASDGLLTVDTWGIPSYQQNTFPQNAIDATRIFSFQIGSAAPVPEPGSLAILMAGLAGFAPFVCRRRGRA
jgi:phosphodiesterase/alkaline phosphatase D-like protein